MGKQIFRVGEVVYCSNTTHRISGNNCPSGFGQVKGIIDLETGEIYQEKEILTGWGQQNTKVRISVDILATLEKDDIWDISVGMVMLKDPHNGFFDPHSVIKTSMKRYQSEYIRKMNNMKERIKFLESHSMTRENKIDKILDES